MTDSGRTPGPRIRKGLRRLQGVWAHPGSALRQAGLRFLARVHGPRRKAHPFFQSLHDLLEPEGDLKLQELLENAGEQTYGLLILLLALASFIPGVSIVGGVAILVLGLQMAAGIPHPWLPRRAMSLRLHKGRVKETLARFEGWLVRFGSTPTNRRPLNRRALGVMVVWASVMLALPVPPMVLAGNALPAAALCLMGAALLEERPGWAWAGVLGALLTTAYLAFSFELIFRGVQHLLGRG